MARSFVLDIEKVDAVKNTFPKEGSGEYTSESIGFNYSARVLVSRKPQDVGVNAPLFIPHVSYRAPNLNPAEQIDADAKADARLTFQPAIDFKSIEATYRELLTNGATENDRIGNISKFMHYIANEVGESVLDVMIADAKAAGAVGIYTLEMHPQTKNILKDKGFKEVGKLGIVHYLPLKEQ